MKSFKQYNEAKKKSVVFTFGRFNPPTTGHEKLLNKVASIAIGSDYRVYASQSNDPKKNPLEYSEKVKVMRKMFPKHGRNIILDKKIKTVFDIATSLYDQGFTQLTMVVGSDRVSQFRKLLNQYNAVDGKHGYYDFSDGIEIVSAGERDPDADDVSGMSASKMRAAAAEGDFKLFSQGLPRSYGEDMTLFNLLRKRMGLKEMVSFRKHIQLPSVSNIREKYVAGEIFNVGDIAYHQNHEITIAERRTNFIIDTNGNKHFIDSLAEKIDPDYVRGLSKSTSDKRSAQFKRQAKMKDDDPRAYKVAPGDARAKTKTSQYTKAYHKKFGKDESVEEGVDDPAIFKAVFLAGGPGSGKSFTVGKTGLSALGFKIVNSDKPFEISLKNANLEPSAEVIFSPRGQEIRKKAKELTSKQMDLYLDGRLGLVIDGTGKDFAKISEQVIALKKLGYDVSMIFVNTNLETAIARDAKRSRTLGADQVKKMWQSVQDNIGKFQSIFGNNLVIVDNSEGSNIEKATLSAYKRISKFAKEEPKNPIAKKWINKAKGLEEGKGKSETWEQGYERRVVKTTEPEHIEKGYKWRIKGKDRDEISIKLYKTKPDFTEFKKQMNRVAGWEFGKRG